MQNDALGSMPLSDTWVLRAHSRAKSSLGRRAHTVATRDYCDLQTVLSRFGTVAEMWQVLNNVPFPSEGVGKLSHMKVDNAVTTALSMFRGEYKPMWEQYSANDGMIEFRVTAESRQQCEDIGDVWRNLVLDTVGGDPLSVDMRLDPRIVVGLRVVDKSPYVGNSIVAKIEIWLIGVQNSVIRETLRKWVEKQVSLIVGSRMSRVDSFNYDHKLGTPKIATSAISRPPKRNNRKKKKS